MYTLSDNKSGLAGRLGVQGVSPCLARVGFSTRARTSWLCISLAATGRKGLRLPGATPSVVPSGKCRLEALARVRAFLVALWWLGAFSLLALPQVLASSGLVGLSAVSSSPAVAWAHSIAFRVLGYSFVSVLWLGSPVVPVMIARPGICGRLVRAVAFCGRPWPRFVALGVSLRRVRLPGGAGCR